MEGASLYLFVSSLGAGISARYVVWEQAPFPLVAQQLERNFCFEGAH